MCDFCQKNKDIVTLPLFKNDFERCISITKHAESFFTIDFAITSPFDDISIANINYCPMCGLKLGNGYKSYE